ncbi:hypothetical protein OG978_12050 [Streptomyces sp. NBC_01591]|uniref:hypothetical protein n=1 Tax=Streptomyces sp. NBC_01591 TaxID=2975888 RepID=UPI002DD837CC|nr:hypothetical protein [Streptomyces sp. NBC_01591]WSD68070.1 hypothetical protein OG978_12050 [Streptomyces sp. NBC_01591]
MAKGFLADGYVSRDLNRYRSAKPAAVKNRRKIQEALEACDLAEGCRTAAELAAATTRWPDKRS